MATNFTIVRNPINGTLFTAANSIYIDADCGNDANSGTIDFPKKTLATAVVNKAAIIKGRFEGAVGISTGSSQTREYYADGYAYIENIKINTTSQYATIIFHKIHFGILNSVSIGSDVKVYVTECFVGKESLNVNVADRTSFIRNKSVFVQSALNGKGNAETKNVTLVNFRDIPGRDIYSYPVPLLNSIVVNSMELENGSTQAERLSFDYCVFFKTTTYTWEGVVIPISYGSNPALFGSNIKSSMQAYATANNLTRLTQVANSNFIKNSCIIWDDDPTSPTFSGVRIFAQYEADGITPKSYTLNPDPRNPALTMGSNGEFVGAIGAGDVQLKFDLDNILSVSPDGQTVAASTSPIIAGDATGGIFNDIDGNDLRSRVESDVIKVPNGTFVRNWLNDLGFVSDVSNGWYLGAWREPAQGLLPIDAIEVLVYDNENTPTSADNRRSNNFFMPIDGKDVEVFRHAQFDADLNDYPVVLFGELAELGIARVTGVAAGSQDNEYDKWAVTNAVAEAADLYALVAAGTLRTSRMRFRWAKFRLTFNRTPE